MNAWLVTFGRAIGSNMPRYRCLACGYVSDSENAPYTHSASGRCSPTEPPAWMHIARDAFINGRDREGVAIIREGEGFQLGWEIVELVRVAKTIIADHKSQRVVMPSWVEQQHHLEDLERAVEALSKKLAP